MCLHPSGGSPTSSLKIPFSLNLTHQGECGQKAGATNNMKFNGIKHFIFRKTIIVNTNSIPQVHHQDIIPPASRIRLATLLSSALTSCLVNREKPSPSLAPPAPTLRPASTASTPLGPVDSTLAPLRPEQTAPAPTIPSPRPLSQRRLWSRNHGGSAIR